MDYHWVCSCLSGPRSISRGDTDAARLVIAAAVHDGMGLVYSSITRFLGAGYMPMCLGDEENKGGDLWRCFSSLRLLKNPNQMSS